MTGLRSDLEDLEGPTLKGRRLYAPEQIENNRNFVCTGVFFKPRVGARRAEHEGAQE